MNDRIVDTALPRRAILGSVALIGMAAWSGGVRHTGGCTTAQTPIPGNTGSEVPGHGLDPSTLRRLHRAAFPITAPLTAAVAAAGWEAWLKNQLSPNRPEPPAGRRSVLDEAERQLSEVAAELPGLEGLDRGDRQALRRRTVAGLTVRYLFHAAYGVDQLRQRMVDLLADLLHVSISEAPEVYLVPSYDSMLRDRCFGRFDDLLVASAQHPAMLLYLNQAASRADGDHRPNENYARELMELHTVGPDGGYSEADVLTVAHLLSGWTVRRSDRSFEFRSGRHRRLQNEGVLGYTPRVDGQSAGEGLLRHLARHERTARRLARVLVGRFVSDSATEDHPLVEGTARVYLDHDTELGPTVLHLLTHPQFDQYATLMLRRPLDLLASTLGRTDATWTPGGGASSSLREILDFCGHAPYRWPAPDGYPWRSEAWANAGAMLARINALTTLATTDGLGLERLDVVAACAPEHQLI